MRVRLALALTALTLPCVAGTAQAGGNYPTYSWVQNQSTNTCFTGSTVDPGCAVARPIATDYRLAGLAQTNAILAAQPQVAQDQTSCPGAMWDAQTVVSRFGAAAFVSYFRLPTGAVTAAAGVTVPPGWNALRVNGQTAYSLLTALYTQQLHDGPVAMGLVSLLYYFTPAGIPRASSTPGSMPLPAGPTATLWTTPTKVTRSHDLYLFDLDPAKVHVTLNNGWNDPVAGHGVFIKSLADSAFGDTLTRLTDVTDARGLYSEGTIARALITTSMPSGSIASLSSGTYQCTIGGLPVPPLMLADAVLNLKNRTVHLVSAAGNDNVSTYFYPAAYAEAPLPVAVLPSACGPGSGYTWNRTTKQCSTSAAAAVTAVGSMVSITAPGAYTQNLTGSTKPAGASAFSNFGTWVKAWADGDGVVGSYRDGPFRYCSYRPVTLDCDLGNGTSVPGSTAPTAHLGPTVVWSGTSFAAPMVAISLAGGAVAP